MANNSISLVNLDFDTLKNQLKTYLKSQAQFSDYDFDGSNMSVLLDILTYNSHLNAFYLNMVASEMFLDSAQLRNSVISHAKSLNYVPRSVKSARATVNLRFNQSGLSSFSIPENTRFTGKNSRGSYEFLTNESLVLYPANGAFTASNVSIYQGSTINNAFVVNYAIENQRFVLSNDSIDTDSLQVTVIEDGISTTYTRATTLYSITSTSSVYFLQAAEDTKYEVVFGDGVLGKKPKDGAIISCAYKNSVGADGNECTNFILADNLGAVNGFGSAIIPAITVVSPGFGGGEAETIEDIRTRAPRFYQTQERAITTNDFSVLISQEFKNIRNVYVYGGEENSIPQFGKVFIAPITFTGDSTSQAEKDEIQTFIKDKTTIGISPIVIDPDYLYIGVECQVNFSASLTTLSATDIETKVKQAIEQYNLSQLVDFNTSFRTSRFESAIDNADPSITSNDTNIILRKRFRAPTFSRTIPNISYKNKIVPGTIYSSTFNSNGKKYEYTDFNPNNNTFKVEKINGETVINNTSRNIYLKDLTSPSAVNYTVAGSVDYETGTLTMNGISFTSFDDEGQINGIDFYAKPVSEDVSSKNNDVLSIDNKNILITVLQI